MAVDMFLKIDGIPGESTDAKFQKDTTDQEILTAITDGIPETKDGKPVMVDGKPKLHMPAFKEKLTPEQIQELAKFVRTFGSKAPQGK